ncbi:hypothetical protein HAX54_045395 [Datura stramonium]|uniref:Uncharacterized protein n=1 Tax=Datura stramonium TaxID=4076 RepID=A0ABS8WFR1_DATST|nr:hypothetical protein [Datura stramonium]
MTPNKRNVLPAGNQGTIGLPPTIQEMDVLPGFYGNEQTTTKLKMEMQTQPPLTGEDHIDTLDPSKTGLKEIYQLSYKSTVVPMLKPKMLEMADIPKYDGIRNPQEHMTMSTTIVKGSDLALNEIESVLIKKFW